IVSHMINPNIYIANKIKDEHNIPVILTLHQTDLKNLNNYPKRYKRFTKIINNIDKIGFRSDALKRQFDLLNISYSESFLAPSGIEENVLIKNILLEKKINSQAKNIFIAANMIPLKNIDILIKAFDEVAKKNKHIYLKIAGDGPEKNKLEKLVNQLKLNNRIEFLGFLTREEVLSHMESSDIFAMVSSPETFGLVYLEAMAKGCITIGSLGEGIEGVIQDGINGFLCEPKNIGKLAEKLTTALELDSRNKSDILHNAVDTASKMTGKQMSKNYLEVLKGL
ncbi:glycosyltransferase family 4 protein, partial [Bacillus haikouensis]|uniref:glycosyltransferase family 4 protein n=1 Tax=Bacillus haikouensis TaxID=1510468 RepID=UPI001C130C7A